MLEFIHWNPSPDFVSVGMFSIKWYGLFWGLSLIGCFLIQRFVFQQLGFEDEKITLIIQYVFVGGLVGARLAHVAFYQLDFYLQNPQDILSVWKGGLASHGGVVGGLVGLYVFSRVHKEFPFFRTLDLGIISVAILASLVRLGNLMNSELYGKSTDVPWAFIFKQVDEVPRHAVVLYESIAYFVIQVILIILFRRVKLSRPGIYVAVFFTTVFIARFLLEFFKVPDGMVVLEVISKTQLLNLPFIALGIVLSYMVYKKKLHY